MSYRTTKKRVRRVWNRRTSRDATDDLERAKLWKRAASHWSKLSPAERERYMRYLKKSRASASRKSRRDPSLDTYDVVDDGGYVIGHVKGTWLVDAAEKARARFGRKVNVYVSEKGGTPIGEPHWTARHRSRRDPKRATRSARKRKAPNAFKKVMLASPALASVTGKSKLSRAQANKLVWAYIKRARLQNPKDGRQFRIDGRLRPLFKGKRVGKLTDVTRVINKNLKEI